MLKICGVSNPHNGLSDELLHLLSFMLCFVPKQNKLWKLGVPESCADLYILKFSTKKTIFLTREHMYAEHSLLHLLWWKSPENACQVTSLHKRGNKTVPGKYVFMRCAKHFEEDTMHDFLS